jgi:transglutaminase-like putative cysteine protease
VSGFAVPRGAVEAVSVRPLAPAAVVRLVALGGLALFVAWQWGLLQEPNSRGKMVGAAAVAVAGAAGLWLVSRLAPVALRVAARAGLAVAGIAALLLIAGVPSGLLEPKFWGSLASGLGQGWEGLPTIGVPYRGVDPWIHIVLVVAGGLLLALAGILAVRALRRDRRPLGAALVLTTAYAIPVVVRTPDAPALSGVVFTVLLGALLWGDRIERAHAAAASAFLVAALGAGLIAQPRLDAAEPWIDYEAVVESLSTPPSVGFNWEHGYGPLDWPRENRVMLRVATVNPAYWKALDLETFDGTRWTTTGKLPSVRLTEVAPNHQQEWIRKLRVSIRDLRSSQYITAGVGFEIRDSPRFAVDTAPGTFSTGEEPLRRGDVYEAVVYTANPSVREMRGAGTRYPEFVSEYLKMDLPDDVGGPTLEVPGAPSEIGPVHLEFPQFGLLSSRQPPLAFDPIGAYYGEGSSLLRDSQYADMWALARRLRAQATTPYEYVTLVQEHLADGYRYSERPPAPAAGRPPLVSFLFDTKIGYCQQFSGAMALLLRMGGVPARVSSGFSPGTFDDGRDEWVVRDVDAHSWVEVYFPRLGWVTFDPTPGVAPPNTQLVNGPATDDAEPIPLRDDPRNADVPAGPGGAVGGRSPDEDGTLPLWAFVLAGLGAAGIAGLATVVVGARRRSPGPGGQLAELERALRVTGRPIEPATTLRSLEQRLGEGARGYLRALRQARFGGAAAGPTAQDRTALRRELAAGLGWAGKARAWWALPPLWQR